jgi:hypothetical protein
VREGIAQLTRAFRDASLTAGELEGPRFRRVSQVRQLMAGGALDADMRWHAGVVARPAGES